jgi:hypothetical protein
MGDISQCTVEILGYIDPNHLPDCQMASHHSIQEDQSYFNLFVGLCIEVSMYCSEVLHDISTYIRHPAHHA